MIFISFNDANPACTPIIHHLNLLVYNARSICSFITEKLKNVDIRLKIMHSQQEFINIYIHHKHVH